MKMDYNNFNNYKLTHKDKLRIYYLVSQYYMCLGLQIENYKGILNRNNFIQEPIILYVSTPKNTICKSAMRKNNEDLCGIELAKKFKSTLSVLSENKEIKIKNRVRDEIWTNGNYEIMTRYMSHVLNYIL